MKRIFILFALCLVAAVASPIKAEAITYLITDDIFVAESDIRNFGSNSIINFEARTTVRRIEADLSTSLFFAGGFQNSGQASVIKWNSNTGAELLSFAPANGNDTAFISSAALTPTGNVKFFGTSFTDNSAIDRLTIWDEQGVTSTIEPFGVANLTNGGFIAPNGLLASGENGGDQGVYDLANGNAFTLIPNTGSSRVGAINNSGTVTLGSELRLAGDNYAVSHTADISGSGGIADLIWLGDDFVAGNFFSFDTFGNHGGIWSTEPIGTELPNVWDFGVNTEIVGYAEDEGIPLVGLLDHNDNSLEFLNILNGMPSLADPAFIAGLDDFTFQNLVGVESGSYELFGSAIQNSSNAPGFYFGRAEVQGQPPVVTPEPQSLALIAIALLFTLPFLRNRKAQSA